MVSLSKIYDFKEWLSIFMIWGNKFQKDNFSHNSQFWFALRSFLKSFWSEIKSKVVIIQIKIFY